jgi:hypothetical protein
VVLATAKTIPQPTALLRPDLTGPDRLLAGWAAARLHGRPVIIVDLGTATTVDAVDADGFFLGGAILPGLALGAHALAEGTARLPRVELELPSEAIGVDTATALQSGIVLGHLGAVRELAVRMRERLAREPRLAGLEQPAGEPPIVPGPEPQGSVDHRPDGPTGPDRDATRAAVVITGGHSAAAWAHRAWLEPAGPELPAIADVVDPELVLRGLGLLGEHLATRPGAGGLT